VKTGLIWVAIIGAIVALFLLNPTKAPQPAELNTIQQVVELAEQGKIAKGAIRSDATGGRDWTTITGKPPNPSCRTRPAPPPRPSRCRAA